MRLSAILLAACSSGSSATEPPAPAPIAAPAPRVLPPITGAHGGGITALAVTADGLAAVTADTTGGLRLWPALDGTREPVVVHGPAATALAIGRDGQGFAIAITDAAGHAMLVRLDRTGRVRTRRPLGEAMQLEIAGEHVLVLRAEQVVDQIGFDGVRSAQLAVEAGTRVEALLVRGAHAAALVAREHGHHIAPIALAPLAWGTASPALAIAADGADAVLAPDGKSIAAIGADGRIQRFDLATGKGTVACGSAASLEEGRMGRQDPFGGQEGGTTSAIEILDDEVACIAKGMVTFHVAGGATRTASVGFVIGGMGAGGDRVVFATEHELVIATPERTWFLGYGFRDLTHVRAVPTGLMIGKGDQEPVLLDDLFHERTRFPLPKLRVDWTDLVPIDGRFLIASSTRPGSGDLWGSAYQIAIYDTVKQVMHQVLPHRARTGELVYEPSTQQLVVTDGTRTAIARLDLATHTLGDELTLDLAEPPKRVALLDPQLAGGMIALAIRDAGGGGLVVSELYAQDVPPRAERGGKRTIAPRTTYRVAGELKAVDRAGRLYVRDADGIAVHAHGRAEAQLAGAQAARLRPSPDAQHVVAIDGERLALFTVRGERRWETAAWGSSDVDWTPTGTLFARFPHALARIELATGRLVERQCGWGFGIASAPRDGSSAAPSVCDVAP